MHPLPLHPDPSGDNLEKERGRCWLQTGAGISRGKAEGLGMDAGELRDLGVARWENLTVFCFLSKTPDKIVIWE